VHEDLIDDSSNKSIISECFRGKVEITAEKEEKVQVKPKKGKKETETEEVQFETKVTITKKKTPFFILILNPPPPPIFKDAREKKILFLKNHYLLSYQNLME